MGTHHHIAGPYLWGYGFDAVWREDHSRGTQAEKFADLLGALLNNTVSRTMKGYWQRQLEGIEADPELLDRLGAEVEDDDAIAPAGEIVANEGRMTREDVATVFGEEYADRTSGPMEKPSSCKWKARKPYVPRKPGVRPKPWSELKNPAGLP